MVRIAAPVLTKIGFRRDVKLFLAALVGLLVLLILALVFILQNFMMSATAAVYRDWQTLADGATQALIEFHASSSAAELPSNVNFVRSRFGIASIEIALPRGQKLVAGTKPGRDAVAVRRLTSFGPTVFWFDGSDIRQMRQTFVRTAVVSLLATAIGAVLLFLYLPRIVRPIEEMLDYARGLGERTGDTEESQYLIETFRDSIATLKVQEAELKRLHELEKTRADDLERVTETLTRSLTSGFIALDGSGAIVDVNDAAREILGLRGEVAGRRPADVLPGSPFASTLQEAVLARATLARREVPADASARRVIGLTTVPILGADHDFLGMLALFTDLTPIRDLEARLREAQTLADLGEISAGIAHEFRNSLSTILGYLKLARRSPLPEEASARLGRAEEEAVELAAAVERLLTFSRPMQLEAQEVDLLELAREVAGRMPAEDDGTLTVTGEPAVVRGDRALLARAVENLVRNAAESVQQKGAGRVEVTVSARPVPRIEVADEGIGVDAETTPRLFLPFQSDKPNGYGLGLPLAKKIALLHGGTVRLSPRPAGGAVATIEFPATPGGELKIEN